jgi:aspartate racemase
MGSRYLRFIHTFTLKSAPFMPEEPLIGVVGGMGPYAGLDLVRKIFDQTKAGTDQEHLPVAMLSYAHRIQDRSAYLFGEAVENPALTIAEVVRQLDGLGATVAGIPCNSAHAPPIFDAVKAHLCASGHRIRLLHMIEEAAQVARSTGSGIRRIGALSTLATHRLGLYQHAIEAAGFEAVLPEEEQARRVHQAIYDPTYGIKAHSNPVTDTARRLLIDALAHLRDAGAEAVMLGCTELPLAVSDAVLDGTLLIDPTRALARALIRETYPEKLRGGKS